MVERVFNVMFNLPFVFHDLTISMMVRFKTIMKSLPNLSPNIKYNKIIPAD